MPQSLHGYGREWRDDSLRVDPQHLVVSVIDHAQTSFAIEGNAIRTLEEIALRKRRDGAGRRNLGDRVAAAVRDIDVAGLPVDRNPYGAAQAADDERRGLAG